MPLKKFHYSFPAKTGQDMIGVVQVTIIIINPLGYKNQKLKKHLNPQDKTPTVIGIRDLNISRTTNRSNQAAHYDSSQLQFTGRFIILLNQHQLSEYRNSPDFQPLTSLFERMQISLVNGTRNSVEFVEAFANETDDSERNQQGRKMKGLIEAPTLKK